MTESAPALATDDPFVQADFKGLYDRAIRPELETLEVRRKQALLLLKVAGPVGLATAVIINMIPTNGPEGLLMIGGIALAIVSALPLLKVMADAKDKIVGALCVPLGLNFQRGDFEPSAYKAMRSLHLLPGHDGAVFEDRFTGARRGCDFELCDASLTSGSGKSQTTVFQGQLLSVRYPRKILGTTVVLRDGGWLNRFQRPKDTQRVGLEDPVFERAFEVFGTDQVEARYILTPDFMEKLLELETALAGGNLRCAFAEGRIMVAVEGANRFEIGGMFKTLVDYGRVEAILADLAAVFALIDSFVGRGART